MPCGATTPAHPGAMEVWGPGGRRRRWCGCQGQEPGAGWRPGGAEVQPGAPLLARLSRLLSLLWAVGCWGRAGLELPSHSPLLFSSGLISRRLHCQLRGKCSHWTDCCSLSLHWAQLFRAAHPSGCEKGRAPCVGRRKEEKLVGGVSPAHVNPFPANPNLPPGPSQHWGKFLVSRQPSWIWRRQQLWLWN